MRQATPSLKPFVAWVTDLTDRYRFNPSIRATIQIVILQVGLTILMILIFGWALEYAQTNTVGSIAQHVQDIVNGSTTDPAMLSNSIAHVRERAYTYVFIGMIVLNTIFGFLIARFALRPARETLSFQKQFIGNIAHEIRTPLAIIKTSTEVALLDPSVSPAMKEMAESTLTELDRISETINNLLSFDNLTRPRNMKFEEVDVSAIAETVIARHSEFAASRSIRLISEVEPGHRIIGNSTALDQVITNLTKNAINYTPQHKDGKVTVSVAGNDRGEVVVTIADTGIGIAQKDLYHIFEPFYRGDTSRARGIGTGTSGLGLAIVNEIVRVHRGTITIRSFVGHGTTIKVAFPEADVSPLPHPLPPSDHESTSEVSFDFT